LPGRRQGEARRQRLRRDEAGLEEDFVLFRQHDQPQVHVAGDAGVAEIEGVAGGGVQDEAEDFVAGGDDAGHDRIG